MANFRFHRGGLAESLKTEQPVQNVAELEKVIERELDHKSIGKLICTFYGRDERLKKDLYLVTLTNFGVVGWLDDILETEKEAAE